MITAPDKNVLWVVSAPSGAGKTTLCERLLAEFSSLCYSVSCTTRPPREGEVDGREYHFITKEAFLGKVAEGQFVEHAEVHGFLYGTLREHLTDALGRGQDVLLDIDVQGAEQLRTGLEALPEDDLLKQSFVDVFIAPPSLEVLEERLRGRGKDADEVIRRRLDKAADEIACWPAYQYLVVNDELDTAYDQLRAILVSAHCRTA